MVIFANGSIVVGPTYVVNVSYFATSRNASKYEVLFANYFYAMKIDDTKFLNEVMIDSYTIRSSSVAYANVCEINLSEGISSDFEVAET